VVTSREPELHPLIVSRFALDGGAMFGVIPRPMWERVHPPDERGRIDLVARVLVARFPEQGRVVVVDAGMGLGWSDRERDRFKLDTGAPGLDQGLADLGIAADEVTDAVMTHLHFDHAGGWVRPAAQAGFVPVLPRAVHHVQRAHLDWARSRSSRDRGSFAEDRLAPLEAAGLLHPIDGEGELFPGLEVMCVDGHTTGLQIPLLRGPAGAVAFPADLMPTAAHACANWIMAYDLRPLETLAEKRRFLARAHTEGWIVVLEHDPAVEAAVVESSGGEAALSPCACPRAL
jgi:glyoxylase-like metal-dependent hydrolase (beta-lactamase superfamily II)